MTRRRLIRASLTKQTVAVYRPAYGTCLTLPAARAQATSMCTVDYSLVNSWPGGFQAGITITNDGPAITSWTLAFTFPNGQVISDGTAPSVRAGST